jgi:hypothetical protein
MPDSTETLIYINAPTLDNTDACTFIKNNDFNYATVGETENGEDANLVLYNKFIELNEHSSLEEPDLSRITFKSGVWAQPDDIGDRPAAGGDYHINGAVRIKSQIFKTGKLKTLKFRFFEKTGYALNNETEKSFEPSIIRINNADDEKAVGKIVIFVPYVVDGRSNQWTYGASASLVSWPATDGTGLSNEDWFTYEFDEEFVITAEMLKYDNNAFTIAFIPNNATDAYKHGLTNHIKVENGIISEKIYEDITFRNLVGNDPNFTNPNTVLTRSVPRGSIDSVSYVIAPTGSDTSNGTKNGQNRLIEFEYGIDTDLVNEYIGENSEKHHLDIKEVQELNSLRYDAPLCSPIGYEVINTAAEVAYISDASITRRGAINMRDKIISSIRIPFQLKEEENYLVNGMRYDNILTRQGGLSHTNRDLGISLDNGITWVYSKNYLTYSYFNERMIYEWKFESDDPNELRYKGQGIKIKARIPVMDTAGGQNFAFEIYRKGNSYYAYSPDDRVDTTDGNYKNLVATPNIKIKFNYTDRGEWFDYIENTVASIKSEIDSIKNNNSGFTGESINLGKWRIYTNANGELVIDTEALAAAGKSIIFKDIEI